MTVHHLRRSGDDLQPPRPPDRAATHPLETTVSVALVAAALAVAVIGGNTSSAIEAAARLVLAAATALVTAGTLAARRSDPDEPSLPLLVGVGLAVTGSIVEAGHPYERGAGLSASFNVGLLLLGAAVGVWGTTVLAVRWRRHEQDASWSMLAVAGVLVATGLMVTGVVQPLLLDRDSGALANLGSLGSEAGGLLQALGLGGRSSDLVDRVSTTLASLAVFSLLVASTAVAASVFVLLRRFRMPPLGITTFVAISLAPLAVALGSTVLVVAPVAGLAVELLWRLLPTAAALSPRRARRLAIALAPLAIEGSVLALGGQRLGIDLPARQIAAPLVHAAVAGAVLALVFLPPRASAGHQGDPHLTELDPDDDHAGLPRPDHDRRRSPRWR